MLYLEKPIKLCCRNGSCPVLRINEAGDLELTDDNGDSVVLTEEQVGLLHSELTRLLSNRENN